MYTSRHPVQSGFTLIELIIVIVIIGIIASVASINSGNGKQELLQTEAKRFQALFTLARQESILQSRHLGIRFFQDGYHFYQMLEPKPAVDTNKNEEITDNEVDDKKPKWQNMQDNILRPRTLPAILVSQLYLEGISVELAVSAKQDKKSVNVSGATEAIKPQVFLLSSGENTAFEYQLNYPNIGRANIKIDATGNVDLNYYYDEQ